MNAGIVALFISASAIGAPQDPAQPAQPQAVPAEQPAVAPALPSEQLDHRAQLDAINVRINDIEGRILVAKEKVDLLRDTILGGTIARSRAVIIHRNEMGASFILEKATYTLDGGVIYDKEDPTGGTLDANKEFEVYNGAINPGEHEITVSMTYGGGSMGFFTYLKGYKFKVDSKYRFVAAEGRLTSLSVVSFAKGDITTATTDRIAVRYDLEVGNVPTPAAAPAQQQPETAPKP